MYDTWDNRVGLKRDAGVDLRGADNKTPVLHYTLSWAPTDRPTKEEMMDAAMKSLKALGLENHQALFAAHNDKDHLHVHIIVNTVNPQNGRTADLSFSARTLRAYAVEYDRQREAELAKRQQHQPEKLPPYFRNGELRKASMDMLRPQPVVYTIQPENPQQHHRRRALERKDTIDRIKRQRAEHNHRSMVEKDALWSVHRAEREVLRQNAKQAAGVAIDYVRDRFKSRWRDLYEAQRIEKKHVEYIQDKPLERAVFVIVNSERLANGKGLSARRKAELIASPAKLWQAVESLHARERAGMAQVEKVEMKERLDRVWKAHDYSFQNLKAEQQATRARLVQEQQAQAEKSVGYHQANIELEAERRGEIPEKQSASGPPHETDEMYTARIRREIDLFYRRQFGPDSVPNIPWKQPAPPTPEMQQPPEPKKPRGRDDDFDNEM